MNLDYYLVLDGQQQGPFRFTVVRSLWREGKINSDTLYWHEGLAEFAPCQAIARILGPLPVKQAEFPISTSLGASPAQPQTSAPLGIMPIAGTILGLFIAFFVLRFLNGLSSPSETSASSAPPAPVVVENSGWDGSVSQVKEWIKENARDPRSVEFVSWSDVKKATGGYVVSCTFRAKNAFGAVVTSSKVFTLDEKGNVTSTYP